MFKISYDNGNADKTVETADEVNALLEKFAEMKRRDETPIEVIEAEDDMDASDLERVGVHSAAGHHQYVSVELVD